MISHSPSLHLLTVYDTAEPPASAVGKPGFWM